jgi:hypothetical protein
MIPTSLDAELSASPGRFVLIDGRVGADEVIGQWEQMLGTTRCSVGARLTSFAEPPSSQAIEALLRPDPLLVDIEVLFASELAVDPLMLLRRLARISSPRLALWPGSLTAGRARFSEPQREDHYDRPVEDVIILRPVSRSFPDEPCFEIERWLN